MAYWSKVQDESVEPEVTSGGFEDIRLTDNGAGLTIYYGDPGEDIPKPDHYKELDALGAADGGQAIPEGEIEEGEEVESSGELDTTSTTVADGTTGEPSDTSASTDTTVAPCSPERPVQAIVLFAGFGPRLRPLPPTTPHQLPP